MLNMKKKAKIILVSLCTVSALVCLAFAVFGCLVGYGMIQAMGPSPKPPIGIVGGEISLETNECYSFAKNRTQLIFPNGTEIDAAPGGWGATELTCFTIPNEDIESFLETNRLTLSRRDESIGLSEAVGVSKKNQKLPANTQLAIQESPPNTKTINFQDYSLYFHKQSGRLWVVCYTKAVFD